MFLKRLGGLLKKKSS